MTRSTSPGAQAMRTLRARRREALQTPSRLEASRYLYRTIRVTQGATGPIVRICWEGRVQIKSWANVVVRSITKHGERSAYLQCLNHVAAWLLNQHPADQVAAKVLDLMEAAPAGGLK